MKTRYTDSFLHLIGLNIMAYTQKDRLFKPNPFPKGLLFQEVKAIRRYVLQNEGLFKEFCDKHEDFKVHINNINVLKTCTSLHEIRAMVNNHLSEPHAPLRRFYEIINAMVNQSSQADIQGTYRVLIDGNSTTGIEKLGEKLAESEHVRNIQITFLKDQALNNTARYNNAHLLLLLFNCKHTILYVEHVIKNSAPASMPVIIVNTSNEWQLEKEQIKTLLSNNNVSMVHAEEFDLLKQKILQELQLANLSAEDLNLSVERSNPRGC